MPLADEGVYSRDLDSALLTREEAAVKEFPTSGKLLHSMRDHTYHDMCVLAGMWCLRVMNNRTLAKNASETILKRAGKDRNVQPHSTLLYGIKLRR